MADLGWEPVVRETYQEFDGPDPWQDGRPTRWRVFGCQMRTTTVRPPYPPGKNPLHAVFVGIDSQAHGRYRVLPLALQDLWQEGALCGPELPELLFGREKRLWLIDYPPPNTDSVMRLWAAWFGLWAAAGALAFAWLRSGGGKKALFVSKGMLAGIGWGVGGVALIAVASLVAFFALRVRRTRLKEEFRRLAVRN